MSYEGNEVGLNHRVMRLNEEIEKMFYYARSSKAVRMFSKGRLTERAPRWVERANKMYPVPSYSPLDQACPCFGRTLGRANLLMFLGCFWLFKSLELFHCYWFIALMYWMLLSVISSINRELICSCKHIKHKPLSLNT